MNSEVPLSRHKQLTRFLCQELLYEYLRGGLNQERKQAVDQFLVGCHESQQELKKLQRGLSYAEHASAVKLRPELHEALVNFEPQLKRRLRALTLWSSRRGWKLLPYAFVSAALVLGAFVFRPALETFGRDLILAEQKRVEPEEASAVVAQVEVPVKADEAAPAPIPAVVEPQGRFFQAELKVENFAEVVDQLREKIIALGGEPEVGEELGREVRPQVARFHFSLPDSARPEFDQFVEAFGKIRFREQKHERVMAEGQTRILFTVKAAVESQPQPPAQAPAQVEPKPEEAASEAAP